MHSTDLINELLYLASMTQLFCVTIRCIRHEHCLNDQI